MNIILLSGGSGKRLWPLSNDTRSKQFIKLFKKKDGTYESMLQRVYNQIIKTNPSAHITIATSKNQVEIIRNQLGNRVNICTEPLRRDTFSAIALSVSYLHDIFRVDSNESVIVCPVDPCVDDNFFKIFAKLEELSNNESVNLNLIGIVPTYPSEKYGYIIPLTKEKIAKVVTFIEKPSSNEAQKLINEGALWNSGVFAFKIGYLLQKSKEILGFSSYNDLFSQYQKFDKISFDYAIAEKEEKIQVINYAGEWKDLGTWNTMTDVMIEEKIGNVLIANSCSNTKVINELNLPILTVGLKNSIVVASNDGILVSDREKSSGIKPIVEKIKTSTCYVEKSWGTYIIKDQGCNFKSIDLTITKGEKIPLQSHHSRKEILIIVDGRGTIVIDGIVKEANPGDVYIINKSVKHMITAKTQMRINEVQIGINESVDADKT